MIFVCFDLYLADKLIISQGRHAPRSRPVLVYLRILTDSEGAWPVFLLHFSTNFRRIH